MGRDGDVGGHEHGRGRSTVDEHGPDLVSLIAYLSRHIQQNEKRLLAPYDLDVSSFETLATLYRHGPPFEMSPTDLTGAVVLTSGAMTSCIDRLEKRGWVERVQDPSDRRGIRVRLTSPGRSIGETVIAARRENHEALIGRLGHAQREQLAQLLGEILESAGHTNVLENQ